MIPKVKPCSLEELSGGKKKLAEYFNTSLCELQFLHKETT